MNELLTKIGPYIDFQKGKAPSSTFAEFVDGLKPYLSPEYLRGVDNPLFVQPNGKLIEIDVGEIIVLWDGSNAGEIFISKKGILASTMTKLIVDEDEFDRRFFNYSMKHLEYILKAKTAGSGIPHVDKGIIKNLEIFNPCRPEQQKIAAILTKVDDAIQSVKNTIAKAERLKKAVMQNLLTGKLKPDGSWRRDDDFYETKIGLFPKHWTIKTVKDISSQVTDGEHTTPKRSDSGIYLLSARNVKNGFLTLDDVDFISEDVYNQIKKRCNPEADDILISCSGTIGNICRFPKNIRAGMVRSVAMVKLIKDLIEPEFVELLFQSWVIQRQIKILVSSSVQGNLFQGSIKKIKIPYPPEDERLMVIDKLSSLSNLVISKELKIQKLERLKKALMQNLLTGKVRVKIDESIKEKTEKYGKSFRTKCR